MATGHDSPSVERAQVEALLDRVESSHLLDGDLSLIARLIRSWLALSEILADKDASLARLRKLLFGPSADNRVKAPNRQASTPAAEKSAQPAQSAVAQTGHDATARQPRPGHGRRPASSYTGASQVFCSDPDLQPGTSCPDHLCTGTLYDTQRPAIFLRFTGQPVIGATRFDQQVLRCSACLTRYTARLPESVPPEKWDASADVAIAMWKYGCGLPFYRLSRAQAAFGIPLADSVQWERCVEVARSVRPVNDLLERMAAGADILHGDDTRVRILSLMRENKTRGADQRKGLQTTAIVARVGEHRIALYRSGRPHAGENIGALLELRPPGLDPPIQMGDALSRNWTHEFTTLVAKCLSHARRQFINLETSFPQETGYVLDILARVYGVEAETKGMSAGERLLHHQAKSGPLMEELFGWIEERFAQKLVEPNSALGKAFSYAQRHREGLTLFLRQEGAPLDNNVAELILKLVVLHRKNSMFYRSMRGAKTGDLLMGLIETCRLNGIVAWDYLLALVRNRREVSARPAQWLPWNYHSALRQDRAA